MRGRGRKEEGGIEGEKDCGTEGQRERMRDIIRGRQEWEGGSCASIIGRNTPKPKLLLAAGLEA